MEATNLTQAEIIVAIVLALRELDLTPILAQDLQTAEVPKVFAYIQDALDRSLAGRICITNESAAVILARAATRAHAEADGNNGADVASKEDTREDGNSTARDAKEDLNLYTVRAECNCEFSYGYDEDGDIRHESCGCNSDEERHALYNGSQFIKYVYKRIPSSFY